MHANTTKRVLCVCVRRDERKLARLKASVIYAPSCNYFFIALVSECGSMFSRPDARFQGQSGYAKRVHAKCEGARDYRAGSTYVLYMCSDVKPSTTIAKRPNFRPQRPQVTRLRTYLTLESAVIACEFRDVGCFLLPVVSVIRSSLTTESLQFLQKLQIAEDLPRCAPSKCTVQWES